MNFIVEFTQIQPAIFPSFELFSCCKKLVESDSSHKWQYSYCWKCKTSRKSLTTTLVLYWKLNSTWDWLSAKITPTIHNGSKSGSGKSGIPFYLFFMFVSISMILLVGFHILMSYEICLDGNHVHFADFLHQTTWWLLLRML